MIRRGLALVLALTAASLSGCPVGPNFVRPEAPMQPEFHAQLEPSESVSFADLPWWDVFRDETLKDLIQEAIENNYDLKTAVARLEQSEHLVGVARAPLFPQAGYNGGAERGKFFVGIPGVSNQTLNVFLGTFNLAWEIDIWGRVRRSTEAAEAQMYASDDFRRAVVLSLVSGVAQSYFELQELDLELDIAKRTTKSFEETLALFTRRFRGGVDSKLSVERAAAALAQTAASIPALEQSIVVKENQICALLGRTPGPVARKSLMTQDAVTPDTPPGLPSQLLERRPDIMQGEQLVRAANASVGVAVADFFPRIGMTALYGGQSTELENLVKGPGVVWSIAGSVMGPLFQGGQLTESYRAAVANWQLTIAQYDQTVLIALGEVSNALIAQQKLLEVEGEQQQAVGALRESVRLATLRYVGGLASYYEVLEAQQQLFPAENSLAQVERDRLIAVVLLYRSLGGGWSQDDVPVDPGFWPKGP